MKIFAKGLLCAAGALLVSTCMAKPKKVLMIGNSFSICVLKEMPAVCAELGAEVDIVSLYIGGCPLSRHVENIPHPDSKPYYVTWHYDSVADQKDVPFAQLLGGGKKDHANIPEMLKADKWDIVTVQQASHESWRAETYLPYGDELVKTVRELAPQAEIVVQETWSYTPWDARQAYETGVSMCRPMYYDSPEDERAYRALNEYMFGDDILAVTVTNAMEKGEQVSKVDVFLPEGKWYDVSSGDILDGGCVLKREYALDQNPWLVRAGAVIPMYPAAVKNLAEPGTDDIELFFAPGADFGRCEVYEDGGTNPDYEANFRKTAVERKGGRIAIGPRAGAYTLRFPCMAAPLRVTVNGAETAWSWDANDFAVVVKTPRMDGSSETVVEISLPDDAAETERMLAGFKGRQREIDALTEEFKGSLRPIHWALVRQGKLG